MCHDKPQHYCWYQKSDDKSPAAFKTITYTGWRILNITTLFDMKWMNGICHLYALCCIISLNQTWWVNAVITFHFVVIHCGMIFEHSLVSVYDGVKEFAIPPAGGEVVTADAWVAVSHPLGPEQQLLLGCHVFWLAIDLNIWDLRWHA